MKVRIAFATDADGNVDTARIGTIEDWPDGDAKELIKQGIAAAASDRDVADWEALSEHRRQVADAEAAQRVETAPDGQAQPDEQATTADSGPRKQRRNRVSGQLEDDGPADQPAPQQTPQPDGTPVTTVAPGAEPSPDVDPADRDK